MTGIRNKHMPMLAMVWKMSIPAMPTHTRLSMRVGASRATIRQRTMMASSSTMTRRQPIKPNSSPQTQKMKSVCRSGRLDRYNDCVCVPLKRPCPVSLPEPRASIPRVCCQPLPSGW